jgi:glycosyltransferase involved in cell wall biosynthesis
MQMNQTIENHPAQTDDQVCLNTSAELPCEITTALANTFVIIPMLNERDSIGLVLKDLPPVARVIVVDNGSTDGSPAVARAAGAEVMLEPQRGYGKACLTGIAHVAQDLSSEGSEIKPGSAIVVFLDGDYSDHPDEIVELIRPMVEDGFEFVVGSRARGVREKGAMHFQAIAGNWLACTLMRMFWGARFSDLGPFRAIGYQSLQQLDMCDENFGWAIEMQIKAFRQKLRIKEVPVSYRRRIGVSKISGTISGTIKAGYKIIYTIFKYRFKRS